MRVRVRAGAIEERFFALLRQAFQFRLSEKKNSKLFEDRDPLGWRDLKKMADLLHACALMPSAMHAFVLAEFLQAFCFEPAHLELALVDSHSYLCHGGGGSDGAAVATPRNKIISGADVWSPDHFLESSNTIGATTCCGFVCALRSLCCEDDVDQRAQENPNVVLMARALENAERRRGGGPGNRTTLGMGGGGGPTGTTGGSSDDEDQEVFKMEDGRFERESENQGEEESAVFTDVFAESHWLCAKWGAFIERNKMIDVPAATTDPAGRSIGRGGRNAGPEVDSTPPPESEVGAADSNGKFRKRRGKKREIGFGNPAKEPKAEKFSRSVAEELAAAAVAAGLDEAIDDDCLICLEPLQDKPSTSLSNLFSPLTPPCTQCRVRFHRACIEHQERTLGPVTQCIKCRGALMRYTSTASPRSQRAVRKDAMDARIRAIREEAERKRREAERREREAEERKQREAEERKQREAEERKQREAERKQREAERKQREAEERKQREAERKQREERKKREDTEVRARAEDPVVQQAEELVVAPVVQQAQELVVARESKGFWDDMHLVIRGMIQRARVAREYLCAIRKKNDSRASD